MPVADIGLGALQAQDYHQSPWAIGSRMEAGTVEAIERAIAERQTVRTWLMRGTIHFAGPGALTITLQSFAGTAPKLVAQVGPEANPYRTFLGLPSSCKPVVSCDAMAS